MCRYICQVKYQQLSYHLLIYVIYWKCHIPHVNIVCIILYSCNCCWCSSTLDIILNRCSHYNVFVIGVIVCTDCAVWPRQWCRQDLCLEQLCDTGCIVVAVCGHCKAQNSPSSARSLGIASIVFSVIGIVVVVLAVVAAIIISGGVAAFFVEFVKNLQGLFEVNIWYSRKSIHRKCIYDLPVGLH